MPKLTDKDWRKLRKYKVAFWKWPQKDFDELMEAVEFKTNPGGHSANPNEVDETDAFLISLSHAEPPSPVE